MGNDVRNHFFLRNVTQGTGVGEHARKGYKAFREDTINTGFARVLL